MKIFLDSPLTEKKIGDLEKIKNSKDRGIVHESTVGQRGEGKSEEEKIAVALDAIELGPTRAAEIHNVPQSSASKYKDGLDLGEEAKTIVLDKKNGIQDTAITKLMQTLNLFDPREMDKPRELVSAAVGLSSIVEKLSDRNKTGPTDGVHIHFYSPRQKSIKDYPVIDVD